MEVPVVTGDVYIHRVRQRERERERQTDTHTLTRIVYVCVYTYINIQMYICIQVSPIMHLLLGRDDWWSVLSVDPSTCTASVEKKKIGFSEAMDILGGWQEEEEW